MDEQTFEEFYQTIVDYANELNLPISYVEEEFVVDGELIKVDVLNESWEDIAIANDECNSK